VKLQDSVFLVTGGSSGLGAACVKRFVGAGSRVVIADVNEEVGQALAGELGSAVRFVKTDVTNEDSVKEAVETAVNEFGSLNGLINCAGVAIAAKVLARRGPHDLASYTRVIQVNLA
jgi:NAD(P)-dependent dehydrogenase (short-subunit alcohol dehydrogenase family)